MAINKKDIIKRLATSKIYIEQWGTEVLICELTAGLRNELAKVAKPGATADDIPIDSMSDVYFKIVIHATRDPETFEPIFTENDIEDLKEASGQALDTIVKECLRISHILPEEQEELKKN